MTDAIGPSTNSMAGKVAEQRLESSGAMARKASTGDGSRLVRPHRDTDSETIDSAAEATGAAQSALSPCRQGRLQQHRQSDHGMEKYENGVGIGEDGVDGAVEEKPEGTDRNRHRLSRVTGVCNNTVTCQPMHIGISSYPLYVVSLAYSIIVVTLAVYVTV